MNKKVLGRIALAICLFLIVSIGAVYMNTNIGKRHSSPSSSENSTSAFSTNKQKYLSLLQLKTNDYKSMSVVDFRNMIFDTIENNENNYLTLIDDAFSDKELQGLRYTNDDASFICNLLIPVVNDSWQNYYYDGYVLRNGSNKNYITEFSIQYEITEPNNLKTAELEDKLRTLPNLLSKYLNESELNELEDEANCEKEVISTTSKVLTDIGTSSIKFAVNYVDYYILDGSEPVSFSDSSNDEIESASDSDMEVILNTFQTDGYEKLSVLSYRTQVANKINENKDLENIINRVRFSIAENQESAQHLTEAQYNFLAYTLNASFSENYIEGAQQYSTKLLKSNIRFQQYLDNVNYYLDYRLYYDLTNEENTTVKTRDESIYNIIAEIQKFVETSEEDELSDAVLNSKCQKIVQNYSNSNISFSIESIYCIPQ